MGDDTQNSFFISYSSEDIDFARTIEEILTTAGYKTIRQEKDFGTKNFVSEIDEALASDARVIALYSQPYFNSDFCRAELMASIAGDPLNKNQRLIPLRITDYNPVGLFSAIAYLDLARAKPTGNALRDIILEAVKPGAWQMAREGHGLWQRPRTILHPEISAVPNFTAREDDLEKLKTILTSGETAAVTAAVSAMGGVGKSVLAQEYAWRNRDDYAGIWWLTADSRENIIAALGELGAILVPGLDQMEDREQAAQLTLQTLSGNSFEKPWLLIYDNVDQRTHLTGLTPRESAHTLITSRLDNWQGYAEKINLGLFTEEEAVAFLLKLTGSADEAGAAELAKTLGYLPLALEQAAAYCRTTGFAEYLKVYQEKLKKRPEDMAYPNSVWATFTLALERVIAGDNANNIPPCPEANKLLGPIAYLAPDDIPLEIFPEDYLPTSERMDIVKALADVSLIKAVTLTDGAPAISIHRLVQDVIRDEAERNEVADTYKAFAVTCIADSFPDGDTPPYDVRFWPQVQKLETHTRAVLTHAPDEGETSDKTSLLLNQYAVYLNARADHNTAEPLYRRALKIGEASLGPDHPNVAIGLNNLALLLRATNRLAEAEPLYRRALAIDETSLGPDHPNVARGLNNLAFLLNATNRLGEAEPLYRRALAIYEASLGPDHPHVATGLNNLASLLEATNRLEEAEPLYRRALEIDEASFGPDHPSVAIRLNNLASLLQDTNRLGEAEPLYRRALEIVENSLPEGHPYIIGTGQNLALLLEQKEQISTAKPEAKEPKVKKIQPKKKPGFFARLFRAT